MIDYILENSDGHRPKILKRFTASSGEQFTAEVLVLQESERSQLTADQVYEHLDALVGYIKKTSEIIEPIAIDEPVANHPWPLKGWEEIEWAKNEAIQWWDYIYFRDENHEDHEDHEDHTDV
jgi:hypothetical protein